MYTTIEKWNLDAQKISFARRYWKKYIFNVYWEMTIKIIWYTRLAKISHIPVKQNLCLYGCNLTMTAMDTIFPQILWMIFCVPEIFIMGDFFTELTQLKFPSLPNLTLILKNSCHHSPLVVFSLLILVGDYFCLGLSLSPATVWRAQSGFHTLRLGRIHLRESFLLKIGKTDLFMQSFEPLCMTSGSGPERLLNILLISSRVSCVWALGVVSSDI